MKIIFEDIDNALKFSDKDLFIKFRDGEITYD
jgi:hypothetical protein